VGEIWYRLAFAVLIILGVGTGVRAFDCSHKYCRLLRNCAEAHYKLTVCHQLKRDGDGDGIPCETLCGKTLPEYHKRLREQGGDPDASPDTRAPPQEPSPQRDFVCAGKHRCGEMHSCDEARFYLNSCGVTSLDRDHDGIPCESMCGGR
jgi:Excalibur calcium-binding domain